MRSGFGLRRHPILGYTKMHTGVDWAAPTGTPIYAAGNGVVEKEGWESGYGKYIRLRHNNGYETAYGHMSAYARGVDEGKRVRQGQVIGFVGSTGLSTGSHVHYEILVNGRFVDPMRIKLPRGRELDGTMMASFEQERDRLDGIMARKPARVASNAKLTPFPDPAIDESPTFMLCTKHEHRDADLPLTPADYLGQAQSRAAPRGRARRLRALGTRPRRC